MTESLSTYDSYYISVFTSYGQKVLKKKRVLWQYVILTTVDLLAIKYMELHHLMDQLHVTGKEYTLP